MHHRGLFRLCSSVVRAKKLKQRWDSGERVDLEHEGDIPTVASLLKLFLRELPTPIVPESQRKQLVLSLTGNRTGTRKSCWTGTVCIKFNELQTKLLQLLIICVIGALEHGTAKLH